MRPAAALLATILLFPIFSALCAAENIENITVVAPTPIGRGTVPDRTVGAQQAVTRETIEAQRAASLTDLLNQIAANVTVNEAQGNPLQADLQYRGFVASPLLGLPQGLAVYVDGVRFNEPFGDTVNWSLIPRAALDSVTLIPGSNPLYGLNTLGGSIVVQTRDGTDADRSAQIEMAGGSFGRRTVSASAGTSNGDWHGFAAAEHFDEDGWRDFSPSEARSLYLRGGWSNAHTRLNLALTRAQTDLIGNGATPVELLLISRGAVYTRPDQTRNNLTQLALQAEHVFQSGTVLRANLYRRDSDIRSLNGDDSDVEPCEDTPIVLCEEETETVTDLNDDPIPALASLVGATVNRTATRQQGRGLTIEAVWRLRSGVQQGGSLVLGLSHDEANIQFGAGTELGTLDATRRAVGGGVFLGDATTDLNTRVENDSVYAALGLPLGQTLTLHAAARFNRTGVTLRDQTGTALNGDHSFSRLNPSVGLTWPASDSLTLYASYSESNRAPSPVELTCADEDDPCRLPNAFLADPPLDDVVASTVEGGLRFTHERLSLRGGVFRTVNEDDILFISAGALTNEGFFDNVGNTRRQGFELMASGGSDTLTFTFSLAWLDATFEDTFSVSSENHPLASNGEILVHAGDRLPLVPQTTAKAALTWNLEPFTTSLQVRHAGGFHYRGDEGNLLPRFGAVTVAALRAQWQLHKRVTLTLDIDNLLDREYETFGVFGEAHEVLGDNFGNPAFRSPAAPRAVYAGIRATF